MIPLVLMTAVLGACSSNASSSTASSTTQTANATSTSQTKTNTSDYFASEDSDASYDESKAMTISLSGSSAKTSGDGAECLRLNCDNLRGWDLCYFRNERKCADCRQSR